MPFDTLGKNTLAPLVLRVTLAGIFLYHGLDKVTGHFNDWGASWATTVWKRQSSAPEEVLSRVAKIRGDLAERVNEIQDELKRVYLSETREIPAGLQYHITQLAVAWGELLCGVLLLVGLMTRLSALAMIAIQAGAIATVTWARGFYFAEGGGYEYNVALLAMCVAVVLLGGGTLSMDGWLRWKRSKP